MKPDSVFSTSLSVAAYGEVVIASWKILNGKTERRLKSTRSSTTCKSDSIHPNGCWDGDHPPKVLQMFYFGMFFNFGPKHKGFIKIPGSAGVGGEVFKEPVLF